MADPLTANTILLTILTVSGALKSWLDLRSQRDAKSDVDEVKATLMGNAITLEQHTIKVDDQLATMQETAHDTHVLVNSQYMVQLKLNAVLARRLAKLTKDPKDVKAAEDSERLLAEHMHKQSNVDHAQRRRTKS